MLFAAVQVKVPSGITVNEPPAKPVGMLKPVIASAPVMWNSRPVGVTSPAADATAVVGPLGWIGFCQPGYHMLLTSSSHCSPVLTFTHGVITVLFDWPVLPVMLAPYGLSV